MSRRIISLLMIVCLSAMLVAAVPVSAASDLPNGKVLFICSDPTQIDKNFISVNNETCVALPLNDLNFGSIRKYSAVAVSADTVKGSDQLTKALRQQFRQSRCKVYIYGQLTIADYKKLMDLSKFGASVDVYDQSGQADGKAYTYFGEQQENETVENIIAFSANPADRHLIANIASENLPICESGFWPYILQDFSSSQIKSMATIVKSGFNYRSYYNSSNYLDMDYLLYKDSDESDPTYDYFAIKTNFCAENDSNYDTFNITAKHELPFSSDEMIDFGPGDITRAGSVSVSLDLSGGASLGYSFDVGGGPTIDSTYSATNDYCTWSITKYWLYGAFLQNNLFALGSSWASTGTYAATDVTFKAIIENGGGFPLGTTEKVVQIRYNY